MQKTPPIDKETAQIDSRVKRNLKPERYLAKGIFHVESEEDKSSCGLENLSVKVSKMIGVSKVETNHISHTLYIEYDPKRTTIDKIRKKAKGQAP